MISFSQRLMTTVATPFPIRFVMARHSLMKRSIPTSSASDSIGMPGTACKVAASVTKPAPVTPLAPLDVIIATSNKLSWWLRSSGVLVACARKTAAMHM